MLRYQLISSVVAAVLFVEVFAVTIGISDTSIDANVVNRTEPLVISCIGDSITNGSIVNTISSYPAFLQAYFDPKSVRVINFGLNGATILSDRGKPFWNESEYSLSVSSSPDYVILQFGTNDAEIRTWDETNFISQYINLIEKYQSLESKPSIFLCIPPPISCPCRTRENEAEKNCWVSRFRSHIVNTVLPVVIRKIAEITKLGVIDNFNILGGVHLLRPDAFYEGGKLKGGELSNIPPYDGIHPNILGNKLMAENIATALMKLTHTNEEKNSAKKIEDGKYLSRVDGINDINHRNLAFLGAFHEAFKNKKPTSTSNEKDQFRPVISCIGVSTLLYAVRA